MTYKDYLKEKFDAIGLLRAEKKPLIDQIIRVQDKLKDLEARRQNLRKGLPRDNQKPEQILKAIADLEKRYETTSLKNPQEEKKILNDVKVLKATLPAVNELGKLKPEIDSLYD